MMSQALTRWFLGQSHPLPKARQVLYHLQLHLSLPKSPELFSPALDAEGVPGEMEGPVSHSATARVSLVSQFLLLIPVERFHVPCGTHRLLLCPTLGFNV